MARRVADLIAEVWGWPRKRLQQPATAEPHLNVKMIGYAALATPQIILDFIASLGCSH